MTVKRWVVYLEYLLDEGVQHTPIRVEWLLEFLRECPADMPIKGIPLHPYISEQGTRFFVVRVPEPQDREC